MYMLDCLTIAVLLLIFEDPPCLFFTELVPFSIPARAWIWKFIPKEVATSKYNKSYTNTSFTLWVSKPVFPRLLTVPQHLAEAQIQSQIEVPGEDCPSAVQNKVVSLQMCRGEHCSWSLFTDRPMGIM